MSRRTLQGTDRLVRKLSQTIPRAVERELRRVMGRYADQIVAQMKRLAPTQAIADGVDWSWGDAPAGAVVLGQVGRQGSLLRITIYAQHFTSQWFEFGTAERYHKSGRYTGRITAQPYFWPSYRLNKRRVKSGITRAIRKGLKEGSR